MTLWFALKHPQTPWHARAFAAILTAYALSPIDLIPDFIPVLGYLDDLIIVPVGVWLPPSLWPDEWHAACGSRDPRQTKKYPFPSILGVGII